MEYDDDENGWGRPGFIFFAIVLGVTFCTNVVAYGLLPAGARIPMQVNASGNPINYMDKEWALFFPVVVMLLLGLVCDFVPFMPRPKRPISNIGRYSCFVILFVVNMITVWMAFRWGRS